MNNKILVTLVLISLWESVPHKQYAQTHEVQHQSNRDSAPIPPPTPIGSYPPSAVPCNNTTNDGQGKSEPSGWWIIGITAIYTVGSIVTLLVIRNQNKSIQNSERAFLIPVWTKEIWLHPFQVNQPELRHCLLWKFRNEGKTPAFLREIYGRMVIVDSLEALPARPEYPKNKIKIHKDDPLPSHTAMERDFWIELEGETTDFNETALAYKENGKILYAYGVARYKDMFGRKHETRWGVRYAVEKDRLVGEWVVDGPDDYNNYA